jgi:hypothetical protein
MCFTPPRNVQVASVVPPSIATSAGTTGEGGGKLGDVVGRMRDLATGHKCDKLRRSRRDKASLKGTFRWVLQGAMACHVL